MQRPIVNDFDDNYGNSQGGLMLKSYDNSQTQILTSNVQDGHPSTTRFNNNNRLPSAGKSRQRMVRAKTKIYAAKVEG